MLYTRIPGTELECSTICLGTGSMGSAMDQRGSFAMLDAFTEAGGNFVDSANCYANWLRDIEQSASEKTLGRWLKATGQRSRVVVATKGGHPEFYPPTGPRLSSGELWLDVEDSLANLQVEAIDLYWLHRDDPGRPVEEILSTLNDMVVAGRIRYFGCSNWRASRIREALQVAAKRGWDCFVGDQMLWSLAVVDEGAMADKTLVPMSSELRALHEKTGMAAIPYSSQANGLFSKLAEGRLSGHSASSSPSARGALSAARPLSGFAGGVYALPENERRSERLAALGAELGLTPSQLVLAYLICQPFPTIPIVGCRTLAQLADSLSAVGVTLDAAQLAYLSEGSS